MKVVRIDVSQDGNRHAMSKHQLLWTWPDPLTVCDIASLIGFAIFYSNLIPHFEVRTKRVHEITKLAYLGPVAPHFNKAARLSRRILSAMISDQCMIWFDHRKCLYLRTDISALNFGYASTQLTDDKESLSWKCVVKLRELRSNSLK